MLSTTYYANNQFSFSSSLSFNKYNVYKVVDGGQVEAGSEANYFAFDAAVNYSFRSLLNTNAFDPTIFVGGGVTKIGEYQTTISNGVIPANRRLTFNMGFGVNYWLSES